MLQSTPISVVSPGRTKQEFSNRSAFAALKEDGSVVAWTVQMVETVRGTEEGDGERDRTGGPRAKQDGGERAHQFGLGDNAPLPRVDSRSAHDLFVICSLHTRDLCVTYS